MASGQKADNRVYRAAVGGVGPRGRARRGLGAGSHSRPGAEAGRSMGGLAAGGLAARSGAHAGSSLAAPSPRGRGTSGRRVGVGRAARLGLGYQTWHRTFGCIGEPRAQWNASAKAARFCSEPSTLRVDGGA